MHWSHVALTIHLSPVWWNEVACLFRYSDQKGPDINVHNKEYFDNHSSYTFLLCDTTSSIVSDYVDQLRELVLI